MSLHGALLMIDGYITEMESVRLWRHGEGLPPRTEVDPAQQPMGLVYKEREGRFEAPFRRPIPTEYMDTLRSVYRTRRGSEERWALGFRFLRIYVLYAMLWGMIRLG